MFNDVDTIKLVPGDDFLHYLCRSKLFEYFYSSDFSNMKSKIDKEGVTVIYEIILKKLREIFSSNNYFVSYEEANLVKGVNKYLTKHFYFINNTSGIKNYLGYVEVKAGLNSEFVIAFYDNKFNKISTIITS